MTFGALLILAAAGLTGYNLMESGRAGASSAQAVQALETHRTPEETQPEETAAGFVPDHVRFPNMEMPVVCVDGQNYLGTLQIPLLDLELPVIADWSYEALKIAPCRYEGSAYSGGLILMAHNYESHFGRLKELRPGDAVSFADVEGNVFAYRVADLEEIPGTAVEDMSAGEWDLTLFTCTYGGQNRVTIRCVSQEE
jgi:sortase A